mgnify:CR=1 FL=1
MLLTSLKVRNELEKDGHGLLEILERREIESGVPEEYRKWVNSVDGQTLPAIALAPRSGGRIVSLDLPADMESLKKLLADKNLDGYFRTYKELRK